MGTKLFAAISTFFILTAGLSQSCSELVSVDKFTKRKEVTLSFKTDNFKDKLITLVLSTQSEGSYYIECSLFHYLQDQQIPQLELPNPFVGIFFLFNDDISFPMSAEREMASSIYFNTTTQPELVNHLKNIVL